MMGVLIEYVEVVGNIDDYVKRYDDATISTAQMEKVAMLDMRLENMDRNLDNMLVRLDDGGSAYVVPINHMCTNGAQSYNLMSPHWLDLHKSGVVDDWM